MYCISEKQIDFILNDISARGIEMVSLQQNLLDHICCIIEHNLEEDGDFESFYSSTITSFYKQELREIEEETINLLIHKNYYVMKKIMLVSGSLSASIMTLGILFKFMHWPGASALILLGILLLSLVFLPLLFVLKAKEKKESKDKIIIGLGALASISLSLGVLFKIMHWPFANILCISALMIMVFLFLPIYYLTGIKNPETKVNTTVSSIIIIVGSALILTLVRSPSGTQKQYANTTRTLFINEQILQKEQQLAIQNQKSEETPSDLAKISAEIFDLTAELKRYLLEKEIGQSKIDSDFEAKNILIGETWSSDYLSEDFDKLKALKDKIEAYNSKLTGEMQKIQLTNSVVDGFNKKIDLALNDLIQIQMITLQNQMVAVK